MMIMGSRLSSLDKREEELSSISQRHIMPQIMMRMINVYCVKVIS